MNNRGRGRDGGHGRGRGVSCETVQRGRGRGRGRGISCENVESATVPAAPRGRGKTLPVTQTVAVTSGRDRPTNIPANQFASEEFVQATSTNLPTITFMRVAEYFLKMRTPEQRHAKDNM